MILDLSRVITKRIAMVIGVNGQDGFFLAKALHLNGWSVIGLSRQDAPHRDVYPFLSSYYSIDLNNTDELLKLLDSCEIDFLFYVAAIHGPAGFQYENHWLEAHTVNTVGIHAVLEHVRCASKKTNVIYFSSSKVFGDLAGKVINEESAKIPSCLYSITKTCAHELICYYRNRHGLSCSVIWLFNHDSERRSDEYFVMKVISALQLSEKNRDYVASIWTLDFWCDWGSAGEYMKLLADYCDKLAGVDVILATGRTVWARDVVEEMFKRRGLSINKHIHTETKISKDISSRWSVDISKLFALTGSTPRVKALDVFESAYKSLRS